MTEFPYAGHVRAALLCREWARQRRRVGFLRAYPGQIEPDVCELFQLSYRYLAVAKATKSRIITISWLTCGWMCV